MRRIILLIVVAVVLMALAVSPAFAQNDDCQSDEQGELCSIVIPSGTQAGQTGNVAN